MSYKRSKDLLNHSNCSLSLIPSENVIDDIKLPPKKASIILPPILESYEPPQSYESLVNLEYIKQDHSNFANPEGWGPAFWFSLHNGAMRFPKNATPTWQERMKNFIIGIPVMVPCEQCGIHATAYIEQNYNNLDSVVKGRDTLVKFFCDFHNYVNKRVNKPEMSLDNCIKLYSSPSKVTKLNINFN
jgi:hypothetical protein